MDPSGNGHGRSRAGSPDIRLLDPRQVQVTRDAFDRLRLAIPGEEARDSIRVSLLFPLTRPDQYISLRTEEGEEIGLLADLRGLEKQTRRLLEEELELAYYTPAVQRIVSVTSQHGATTWVFETDRGRTTVYVKERDDIRRLPGRRVVFTDVHGVRYDLADSSKLDERSRALLEAEI